VKAIDDVVAMIVLSKSKNAAVRGPLRWAMTPPWALAYRL
jgi:hypothetical protein